MSGRHHITIIEDDELLRTSLTHFFRQHGYIVSDFENATGVVDFIQQSDCDLLLCDIMLPETNGLDLVADIKRKSDIGVIFISGKTSLADRISGLKLGADDYICKPIDLTELHLRTTTLLSRLAHTPTTQTTKESNSELSFLDLTINVETRALTGPKTTVELGENEYLVLSNLLSRQGKICSRQQLVRGVTNQENYYQGRGLDQLITRLRKKIESSSLGGSNIITYRGQGYMLPLN